MSHELLSQLPARHVAAVRPRHWVLVQIVMLLLWHGATAMVADAGEVQAYVSNFGDGTVSVIDAETFSKTATIPVGERPVGIVAHPDGSRVYVASRDSNTLSVIDTMTNEVTATVPMAGGPFGLDISSDGSRVYVANRSVGIVQVVDTEINKVISDISASAGGDVAVHPDGSMVYATAGGNINVIDAAANERIDSMTTALSNTWTLDVHPDGSRVYFNNLGGWVGVMDTATNTEKTVLQVGEQNTGIAVHPDGDSVYISNRADDTISIIDTATDSVTDTISVQNGNSPRGLAVHPNGQLLYVTNRDRNSVSTIDLLTNKVLGTIRVGSGPDIGITVAENLGFPSTTRHVAGWQTISRDDRETNIASLGSATQSSDSNSRSIASNAIDGDLTTDARTDSDDAEHWWQVDLGEASNVVGVTVRNGASRSRNLTDGGGFRAELLREDESVAWQQDVIDVDLPTGILDLEIGEDGAGVSANVLRLSKLSPVETGSRGTFRLAEVELLSDSLTLRSDETWAFEIDAATAASDVLGVAGSLHIDGSSIIVSLLDGEPNAGDVFDIIDAGEITGAFNAMTLPSLDSSLQWYTDALSADGTLSVTVRGDFDNSGDFTPGDIDLLGAAAGSGGGVFDLTGDGQIDLADRSHWVTQLVGTQFGDADLDQEVSFRNCAKITSVFKRD